MKKKNYLKKFITFLTCTIYSIFIKLTLKRKILMQLKYYLNLLISLFYIKPEILVLKVLKLNTLMR